MVVADSPQSSLERLAQRVEGDLRMRGYSVGDRYRSAADVGAMLGVSAATAHRAMNELVRRGVLVRRQGMGTFVGPAIEANTGHQVRTVFVFMEEEQRTVSDVVFDDLIGTVRQYLGAVDVQFSFLPIHGDLAHVRSVIESAKRDSRIAGVVAISCSREVYGYLEESGAPVVVLGSLYSDQWSIPSLNVDYYQSGNLLADYLAKRGHKRMALLVASDGRPGDTAFYDGISEALDVAGLSSTALTACMFPQTFDAFAAQIGDLLRRPNPPTAFICGCDKLVDAASATIAKLEIPAAKDLEIVFQGVGQARIKEEHLAFVHVQPQLSFREMMDIVGKLLKQSAEGELLDNRQILVPVKILMPSAK